MIKENFIRKLYEAIDGQDYQYVFSVLDEGIRFQFSGRESVLGIDDTIVEMAAVSDKFSGISHEVEKIWTTSSDCIVVGTVTYSFSDKESMTTPFSALFGFLGDSIKYYHIYLDQSVLA